MARIYQDDITGDEVEKHELKQFGIQCFGEVANPDSFDVADQTVLNEPEAVADKLHEKVDQWLERYQETTINNGGVFYTECHSCGYKWEYTGDKDMATCPDCSNKTPVN